MATESNAIDVNEQSDKVNEQNQSGRPKKSKKAKKIASICGIVLLLVILTVLLVNALLSVFMDRYYPTYGKYRLFSIVSGSMEDTIPTGNMIVSEVPKNEDDIKVGSVITYELEQNGTITLITHRVTEVKVDEETGKVSYTTKGDNNEKADTVHPGYSDVVGIWTGKKCGFFGYFFGFLQSASGAITLILILFVIAVAAIIIHFINVISVWRKAALLALNKTGDIAASKEGDLEMHTVADVIGILTKDPKGKADVKRKEKKLKLFVKTGRLPSRPYREDIGDVDAYAEHIRLEESAQNVLPVTADAEQPVAQNTVAPPTENIEKQEVAATIAAQPEIVTERNERIGYKYTMYARLARIKAETKEWYSDIKNELLSYTDVKCKTSNRYETFTIGRKSIARIAVRGKTVCLSLATDPEKYAGSKYEVQATKSTTPCMYRLKSERRVGYALELIGELMQELNIVKNESYEPEDFYVPYEGVVTLMKKGFAKRTVGGRYKTYKIEEIPAEKK